MTPAVTFVLVHGAWHGGWCWSDVAATLRARGHTAQVVEQLPSAGPDAATLGDLTADAQHVGDQIAAVSGPVVLVGHSYGGMVISELAGHPDVAGAVYLAAFHPDAGRSLFSFLPGPPRWTYEGPDGSLGVRTDRAAGVFYNDCTTEQATAATERLVYQSVASFAQPSSSAGWGAVPTTYVLTLQDHAISPRLQREMSAPMATVIEVDTSHSPFLSQPGRLADLLVEAAAA